MGLCGSSEEANPMPDTLINWAGLFNQIETRIKAKPLPASPFYLVCLMESAEFKWAELTDPEAKEAAYNLLEQTLVEFHKAKQEQEEKEREEKKNRKQRKSQVYGDRDKIPESEMDEMLKEKQASRLLKIVVRFLQRKLIVWNKELQKGEIKSSALKNRERYACVDGEPPVEDDDSDKEDDDKNVDLATKGWVPAPKDDIKQDQMDTFLVGDLDFYQLDAGNPTGLFFKLRYGCRLAENKNYEKAMQVVEKAQGLAQEALVDLEREWAAKLAADEKERKEQLERDKLEGKTAAPSPKNAPSTPKNAVPSPRNAPASPKGGKGGDQIPLIVDPNAGLRDVILMCKTKMRIWHHLHHK